MYFLVGDKSFRQIDLSLDVGYLTVFLFLIDIIRHVHLKYILYCCLFKCICSHNTNERAKHHTVVSHVKILSLPLPLSLKENVTALLLVKWFYQQSGCWLLCVLQENTNFFCQLSPLFPPSISAGSSFLPIQMCQNTFLWWEAVCSSDSCLSSASSLAKSFWFSLSAPAIPWQPTNSFHIIYRYI